MTITYPHIFYSHCGVSVFELSLWRTLDAVIRMLKYIKGVLQKGVLYELELWDIQM